MLAPISDNSRAPVNWALIYDHVEKGWTWRELSIDGSIMHISLPMSDFGAAVVDAIKHGFCPKQQHWIVVNRTGTTHFDPGGAPIAILPNDLVVTRLNGRKRHIPTTPKPKTERVK